MSHLTCECCGEANETVKEWAGNPGHLNCEACANETFCWECDRILKADEDTSDFDPNTPLPTDGWLCESCKEKKAGNDHKMAVEEALEDLGWELSGASNKSLSDYYSHPEKDQRIRIAGHDSPYQSSLECIYICIADRLTCNAHVHAPIGCDVIDAVKKAHDMTKDCEDDE